MIYIDRLGFIFICIFCFFNLYFRKYVDFVLICFELEIMGNMIVGMDFYKFYFDYGKKEML